MRSVPSSDAAQALVCESSPAPPHAKISVSSAAPAPRDTSAPRSAIAVLAVVIVVVIVAVVIVALVIVVAITLVVTAEVEGDALEGLAARSDGGRLFRGRARAPGDARR